MSYRNRNSSVPPKRPRDSATMFRKYLEWNLYEEGKRLSSQRSASYWHRDDIFYRNWRPIARIVHTPGGGVILFLKYDEYFHGRTDQEDLLPKECIIEVDDVGAIGPSGLAVPQQDYLRLVLQQFVGKARHLVDLIGSVAPKSAWDYYDSKAKHAELRARGERNYEFFQYMFDGWSKRIGDAGKATTALTTCSS